MRAYNNKKPWDKVDEALLRDMKGRDVSLQDMCLALGRTGGSVCDRMTTLKMLRYNVCNHAYMDRGSSRVYMAWSDVQRIDRFMKSEDISKNWLDYYE